MKVMKLCGEGGQRRVGEGDMGMLLMVPKERSGRGMKCSEISASEMYGVNGREERIGMKWRTREVRRAEAMECIRELITHLRRLRDPFARLGSSFTRMLDGRGHADLDSMQRGRMIHLGDQVSMRIHPHPAPHT